jgi:predicted nucleotidyltransferase
MLPSANKLTFEYHDKLNPEIWEHGKLKPEIKNKLLEVAQAFLESIDLDIDVEDILFTGSLANYNYTPFSDIDLHILTDFKEYKVEQDLLKDYLKAKKTVWNSAHNIQIKGYDVEAYVQDKNEKHYATGIYSIKNDAWLVAPSKAKPINQEEVLAKVKSMKDAIDHALSDKCDLECAENIKEKIMKTRQAGLEKAGEFSVENLAYKELRRSGDLERLIQGVLTKKDNELSIKNETFKMYTNMFGIETGGKGSRGRRDRGLTAGASKLTKSDTKSVSLIAATHREMETPFHEIENLKKKEKGKTYLIPQTASAIARFYNINFDKVLTQPRGLSTSGIVLGYDPSVKKYYLHKGKK